MSFDHLQARILDEARAQAKHLADTFTAQKTSREEASNRKIRAIEEKIIEQARHQADQQARYIRQTIKLKSRADILMAKQARLNLLESKFRDRLVALPLTDTKALLGRLLALIPSEGTGEIIVGDRHVQELRALTSAYTIVDETLPQEGGFVYRDRHLELNLTISNIVRQLFRQHRAKLARQLFT